MATNFPVYPATSFEQAVDLTIFSSNQLAGVVNGDATSEVETENGNIPSVRKSLVDNFYFKTPIDWVVGQTETVFNQLRFFANGILSGYYYAPRATTTNPIEMGSTPSGDANWVLYSIQQITTPSQVYPFLLEEATGEELTISPPYIFDSAIVTINGVVQVPSNSYTINNSQIILTEPLGVDPDTGEPNVFFAYLGKVEQGTEDYVQATALASNIGSSLVGELASVAELRTLIPTKTNQKIVVKGYYSGTSIGGGTFYYQADSTTVDDSGTFFRVNTSGGWKRQILNPGDLDVTHFGARPYDGTSATDCATAFGRMYTWSQAQTTNALRIGVQFPAGTFGMSSFTAPGYASTVRIAGKVPVGFGYFCATRLVLIGAANSWAITLNARITDFEGINIYGQYDVDGVVRNFLRNTVTAGEYFHAIGWQATQMGGKTFSILDTLDTKFAEFYTSRTYDSVIYALMSGDTSGSWYHITAIELANFNIQYHLATEAGKDAIFLPRAGQSLIYNGWIEHSNYPGNISEGTWIIDQLSMEGNAQPIYAQYSKTHERHINVNGNMGIDHTQGAVGNINGVTRPDWVTSAYEQGYIRQGPQGMEINGSLTYKYLNSANRYGNMNSTRAWCYIGNLVFPATGASAVIRLIGTGGFDSASTTVRPNGTAYGGGEAFIRVQHKGSDSKVTVSWHGEGSTPIADVYYVTNGSSISLYVQVRAYTYAIAALLDTDSTSRFQAGTHFYWNPSMTTVDDITSVSGAAQAPSSIAFGNGDKAFGMSFNEGIFAIETNLTVASGTTSVPFKLNGNTYYVQLSGTAGQSRMPNTTVANLPAASASTRGLFFLCTNTALTPTSQPVYCDGSNWRYYSAPGTIVTASA